MPLNSVLISAQRDFLELGTGADRTASRKVPISPQEEHVMRDVKELGDDKAIAN